MTPPKNSFFGGWAWPIDMFSILDQLSLKWFLDIFSKFVVQKFFFGPRRIFYAPKTASEGQLFWKKRPFRPIIRNFGWKLIIYTAKPVHFQGKNNVKHIFDECKLILCYLLSCGLSYLRFWFNLNILGSPCRVHVKTNP